MLKYQKATHHLSTNELVSTKKVSGNDETNKDYVTQKQPQVSKPKASRTDSSKSISDTGNTPGSLSTEHLTHFEERKHKDAETYQNIFSGEEAQVIPGHKHWYDDEDMDEYNAEIKKKTRMCSQKELNDPEKKTNMFYSPLSMMVFTTI